MASGSEVEDDERGAVARSQDWVLVGENSLGAEKLGEQGDETAPKIQADRSRPALSTALCGVQLGEISCIVTSWQSLSDGASFHPTRRDILQWFGLGSVRL